jgi:flagellar biosynthesis/type III secretory pathway protein FliH
MILSEKQSANIDWKLNELLSASKASRTYVTHPLEKSAVDKLEYSPWSPKQLFQLSTQSHIASEGQPAGDQEGNALLPPEQASVTTRQSEPAAIHDNSRIISDAELEQLRSSAFAAGKKQALDELGQQAVDKELRLRELMNSLADSRVDISGLHRSIRELSLFIASQVVRAELSINPQWFEKLIESCLAEIRLHGNDVVWVRLSRPDFEAHYDHFVHAHESVRFTHDDRLRPGDVEIEMGATIISEFIESKLAMISEHFISSLSEDNSSRDDVKGIKLLIAGDN